MRPAEERLKAWLAAACWALVLLAPGLTASQGFIVPSGKVGPPRLVEHRVEMQIDDNVAQATVVHVFRNESQATIEGVFYFPLPRWSIVSSMTATVNGKTIEGKLLSEDEATRVYEDIVRRELDPSLLKLSDSRTLMLKVYPLEPGHEQTVQIKLVLELPSDGPTTRLIYPRRNVAQLGRWRGRPFLPRPPVHPELRQREPEEEQSGPEPLEEHFQIDLSCTDPIADIYSPLQDVEIKREGERRATIRWDLSLIHI